VQISYIDLLFLFILKVIGYQACWIIDKTRMHLAAESIPVAKKSGAMNASKALKVSLYNGTTHTKTPCLKCFVSCMKLFCIGLCILNSFIYLSPSSSMGMESQDTNITAFCFCTCMILKPLRIPKKDSGSIMTTSAKIRLLPFLLYNLVSIWTIQCQMTGWLMNWKGFERQQ
jgi:hypothetical protein